MDNQKQSLAVPIAIIIAGLLVGFGIYWSGRSIAPVPAASATNATAAQSLATIKSIQPTDHIIGSPNAKVVIVEYSDTECPYCKQYQTTLQQIVTAYSGQVSWVYRNFPLHQRSENEAEAAECAAEQGGDAEYWKYIDEIFNETSSNDTLDPNALPQIAAAQGLDGAKFSQCLSSGRYASLIQGEKQNVIDAGAQGTPYTVIFAAGQKIPITDGALPYDTMKNIVDTVLKNS